MQSVCELYKSIRIFLNVAFGWDSAINICLWISVFVGWEWSFTNHRYEEKLPFSFSRNISFFLFFKVLCSEQGKIKALVVNILDKVGIRGLNKNPPFSFWSFLTLLTVGSLLPRKQYRQCMLHGYFGIQNNYNRKPTYSSTISTPLSLFNVFWLPEEKCSLRLSFCCAGVRSSQHACAPKQNAVVKMAAPDTVSTHDPWRSLVLMLTSLCRGKVSARLPVSLSSDLEM